MHFAVYEECSGPLHLCSHRHTYFDKLRETLVLAFSLVVGVPVWLHVLLIVAGGQSRFRSPSRLVLFRARAVRLYSILSLALYAPVSAVVFGYFRCVEVYGQRYLQAHACGVHGVKDHVELYSV